MAFCCLSTCCSDDLDYSILPHSGRGSLFSFSNWTWLSRRVARFVLFLVSRTVSIKGVNSFDGFGFRSFRLDVALNCLKTNVNSLWYSGKNSTINSLEFETTLEWWAGKVRIALGSFIFSKKTSWNYSYYKERNYSSKIFKNFRWELIRSGQTASEFQL